MSGERMNQRQSLKPNASGKMKKLKDLSFKSDNRVCADCAAPDPKWASVTIGVFICLRCSTAHRNLGSNISKVLSITLDEWSEEEIESVLEVGGNSYANATYEAFLPKGFSKPKSSSSTEERMDFIRSKYELQQFLKPSLRMLSLSTSKKYSNPANSVKDAGGFRSNSSKIEEADEIIGMLRVKVIRGINLAVRDMLTSDPYVILLLGEQKVQTAVITSNLNPVWNEELELTIHENFSPLKLQVYDYDMFSPDDIMGEAEIDIQPLITAAMAFGDPSMLKDMQIGRWLKSDDNALVHDSIVNIVGGKFKQELVLELQNVESGEVELELEWIALDD